MSTAKERLGSRHVTEEFCARLQMETSLLSPAKDGQRWWAATGSQRRVWLAVLLVSGICFAHSLISALPPPPDHVAVGYGPRLSVMLSLDTDNTTTLVLVHGFSLHPLSFSGAKARF